MKQKIKVYKDRGTYIGVLSERRRTIVKKSPSDPRLKLFKKFYGEGEKQGLSGVELKEAVYDGMLNNDICYLLDDEDYEMLLKKELNRRHQILKRYRRKVELFVPNYFVTFTYDDEKCDEDTFKKKLLQTISNLAYRKGWLGIGAAERGKKTDRLHYHFMLYIPEGTMPGELVADYHWNGFRREYFTNNTYFKKRFGDADFKRVTVDDKNKGNVSNYLVKYIIKDGGSLYYTRHLPTEVEMEVDLDHDVTEVYREHNCVKVILGLHLFYTAEELVALGSSLWPVFKASKEEFDALYAA